MEARYLRVKKWREHQHYPHREPPWIKLQRKLLKDDSFVRLEEWEQWQLVRIWVIATDSSRFTLDEKGRACPVVSDDERTLRRAIGSLKKVPLAKLIREGWLVPVSEEELLDPLDERVPRKHGASPRASTAQAASIGTEVREKKELPKAVLVASPPATGKPTERPLDLIIDKSLREAS